MSIPGQVEVKAVLALDKTSVMLTMAKDEVDLCYAIVEPPELDSLIESLSAMRAAIADPISIELEPTRRMIAIDATPDLDGSAAFYLFIKRGQWVDV